MMQHAMILPGLHTEPAAGVQLYSTLDSISLTSLYCCLCFHREHSTSKQSHQMGSGHAWVSVSSLVNTHGLGCALQVLNLRSLKPLDRDTIVKSVRKTHRVVTVEEGWPQCGIGSEITATVNEECFDDLDAAPERITGAEVPMPYAQNLEAAALPQIPDIIRVVKRMMNKQ